jgi:hypothetical protein
MDYSILFFAKLLHLRQTSIHEKHFTERFAPIPGSFILNMLGTCDKTKLLEWLLEFLYVKATLLVQRCLPLCDHHFSLMEKAVEICIVEIATKDNCSLPGLCC